LRQIGVAFEVVPSEVEEARSPGEAPEHYVVRLALDKARTVARRLAADARPLRPVLGADTEVVLGDEILGKPRDAAHGQTLLRRLAGCTHEVLTGVALVCGDAEYSALSRSRVKFMPLSDEDIRRYWATGEPADKAGGYAIQGRAAGFIERIEGSYSGVVGLPLFELSGLLKRAGVPT